VDWDTTAKTASFTAVSGNGYFVNTTSGAVTVTLPATPSAGDIVAVADYANTAITNNITVGRNGSNIEGAASDLTINNNGASVTFVYVDGTRGWKVVNTGDKDNATITNFCYSNRRNNNLLWRLQNSYFYFTWNFLCISCWKSCRFKFSRLFSSSWR
jgi:hypothetical protein